MAVKDTQYRYFPNQERLVNISNYLINPQHVDSSNNGWLDKRSFTQHGGYNVSDSFLRGLDRTSACIVEASADLEIGNVRWSEEIFTVSDLLSLRFPVIIKVVKGYFGIDEQQLIAGEILQVYKSFEEFRVAATDRRGRTLTLPINCPLNVRLQSGSHCSEQRTETLSDLLKVVSFPASIEVIRMKQKVDPTNNHLPSGLSDSRLTLREISRQRFLVANAIKKGWLDQSRFAIIPEQLQQLTFRIATGIRHVMEDEWEDIRGMYSRAARHLKFHLVSQFDDVVYDDWVSQSNPSVDECYLPVIESDGDVEEAADEEEDSDSDTGSPSTRPQLLRQQAPLSHGGSLPSLPTALLDSTTGPKTPGSVTSSHLSTESIQPCKSTESLLPRGSTESITVVKDTVGKRKSNMPPRLLRRKAESRKPDPGTATVQATEFELKIDVAKTGIARQRKSRSVPCSSSTPRSTDPVTGSVAMSRFSEDDDSCNVDNPPDFVFDQTSWKDEVGSSVGFSGSRESAIHLVPESPAGRQGQSQRSHLNTANASSDDVASASLNDVKNKRRKNDVISRFRGSSDDTLLDFQSVDSHVWSPVYWSSDLCIGASVSGAESQMSRMKRSKAQKRSAMLSRDVYSNPNATIDRPPSSLDCPLPRIHSIGGFLDSSQSLFSSTSTELSVQHRVLPRTDRIHQRHQCLSSEDYGTQRLGTFKDALDFRQPFCELGHIDDPRMIPGISPRPEYSNPIKLGISRSRKLSNGLIRMKLDQNGTVLSSGSEVIDDGYSTKGNSMTSSVDTLHARRSVNTNHESIC